MRRAFLAAALAALLVPASAAAHATLKEATPGEQSRVDRPPTEITLRYDQAVTATPDSIASAIASEIGRVVDYRPVETDGARRAAASLAELLV